MVLHLSFEHVYTCSFQSYPVLLTLLKLKVNNQKRNNVVSLHLKKLNNQTNMVEVSS